MNLEKIVYDNLVKYRNSKTQDYRDRKDIDYDFIKALCEVNLSHNSLAKKYGYDRKTVGNWRKRLIPVDIYNTHFQKRRVYTEKEMRILKDITLSDSDVAKLTGRSSACIHSARKRYLSEEKISESKYYNKRQQRVNLDSYEVENNHKRFTIKDIRFIKESKYNNKEIAIILGRSLSSIYSIKTRYKNIDI